MSTATFAPFPSLPFPRGEFLSLNGFGTNDAELAVEDTKGEGIIIARRISPVARAGGGAGTETGAGVPAPVNGPVL